MNSKQKLWWMICSDSNQLLKGEVIESSVVPVHYLCKANIQKLDLI